jgi:aryl sulfotransferase
MASVTLPQKKREQQWAAWDSTRINGFPFRDDDIIIGTWAKSGTTWMQQLVGQLVFQGDPDIYGQMHSPWPEFRVMPKEDAWAMAAEQTHRRFIKTHCPLDCIPYLPQLKYLFVGRDPRDVVWSMYNHHKCLTQTALDALNNLPGRVGPPITRFDGDERAYYLFFLEHGHLPGFSPDLDFWGCFQSWFDARHMPNIMLVHYNNLKKGFEGEARKIAAFLDIVIPEDKWPAILEHCSIDYMRRQANGIEMIHMMFDGGGDAFINKGTNGRWKDVLSRQEVDRCDEIMAERLSPECADWLRTGQMP